MPVLVTIAKYSLLK